jgi:uncharacterized protein (TIGR00369 family)
MTMDPPIEARSATASISNLAGYSGLEFVAGLADGTIRRPSMAETLPFTLLPPEEGKVRLVATPEARFCNLTNTDHGGWIMTMLDTAMSLAAQTTLSPGETCRSHETTAKFVCPISVTSGVMHVVGHVVSRGRTIITLEVRIEDTKRQASRPWHVYMPHREQEAMMIAVSIVNPTRARGGCTNGFPRGVLHRRGDISSHNPAQRKP